MKIFDAVIEKTVSLLAGLQPKRFSYNPEGSAVEGSKNELVMRRDAAYELGAGSLASINYTVYTTGKDLVPADEILLYGKDLCEIGADCNFARIAMLRTDDIELHGEQASYEIIKSIEIKKYDVSPKGYMLRASALSNREQVRVSEGAVKSGITFEQIGNLFIKKYHENSHVQAVRIIFISLDDGPYGELEKLASTSVNISRALNHLISDLKMDCHSCEWKPVCDEVEGMKEIHQKMTEQTNGGIL